MIRFLILLIIGLPIYTLADDSDEFRRTIELVVGKAPQVIAYHYSLVGYDFQQDTTGTLILLKPDVFRLTFWDKVYGSDGASLYVHDKNTRQTIIDSLKWTALPPWLQILNGEIPRTIRISRLPSDGELSKWSLLHLEQMWICSVTIDTLATRLTEIRLEEGDWEHNLLLGTPLPYTDFDLSKLVTLEDLPGTRLDLRY